MQKRRHIVTPRPGGSVHQLFAMTNSPRPRGSRIEGVKYGFYMVGVAFICGTFVAKIKGHLSNSIIRYYTCLR